MQPMRGIAQKIASVLVFITMASLIKATGGRIPPGEVVFFRSLLAVPIIIVWLSWRHELRTGFRTANPISHLWRGLVGTLAMGLGFAGSLLVRRPAQLDSIRACGPLQVLTAVGCALP